MKLALAEYGPATVAVPRGATEPRPIVVAVHGHGIRPERACRNWMQVASGFPFVLCPHGLPADAADDAPVTLGSAEHTQAEIEAGLSALRVRFGRHVASGALVYAGFSLGAKLGVEIVGGNPHRFGRVVLGEGGYAELTRPVAERLARAGIERVLLVCSTKPCEVSYRPARQRLTDAGIAVEVAASGGDVHLFQGLVVRAAQAKWPWLVAGIPAYAAEPR